MPGLAVEDFWKFDMKVGLILDAERIPNSDKLIKLRVDFGNEERVVITGVADQHKPDEFRGKKMIFVTNLRPKKIMGIESQAMLLIAEEESGKTHLIPVEDEVPIGTRVW